MAATSKHYGDLIIWIESVINSCDTLTQLKAVENLIESFDIRLECATNMNIFERRNIIRNLQVKLDMKEYNFYERKI